MTLWGRHGVFIRERSLERCVDLLEYAEDAANAAVRSLLNPGVFGGLSNVDLERAIRLYSINPAILQLLREPGQ
jgi:ribulose-5-phosphate 4-epimerase/fuculose-1-phosphate aldolase